VLDTHALEGLAQDGGCVVEHCFEVFFLDPEVHELFTDVAYFTLNGFHILFPFTFYLDDAVVQ